METNVPKKFYRYVAVVYAEIDQWGDFVSPRFRHPKLVLYTYEFQKETPKGYWIGYGPNLPQNLRSESRWVSKTAKKRYAYPTKEEALNNYIKRTERRMKILKGQIDECRFGLMEAESMKKKLLSKTE